MRILLYFVAIIVFCYVPAETNTNVYRRIRNRVPLFSAKDADTETLVFNLDKARLRCPESSFLFYRYNSDNFAVTCVTDPDPLSHGLVRSSGTEFFIALKDAAGTRNFVFMDVLPYANASFLSGEVSSLKQCSLMCLSSETVPCFAFSFSVISKKCELFQFGHLQHGGKKMANRPQSKNRTLYFEKLGQNSQLYSPEWGVAINNKQSQLAVLNQSSAEACASLCVDTVRCLSFNFFPETRSCWLLSTSDRNQSLSVNEESVFFQLLETPDWNSSRTHFGEQQLLMVPGWPFSLPKGSWVWRFLTPWGRSLIVDFERPAAVPKSNCSLWNVRINAQKEFCQPGPDGEAGQTNSSVNALQITSQETRSDFGLILRTKTGWSCMHSDGSAILLQGIGELASPSYPKPSNNVICKWIISPKSQSTGVNVFIKDMGFHRFSGLLRFQSKTLTQECSAKKQCNKNLTFVGDVTVTYQADAMPIKGFHLSYKFSSSKKPSVMTSSKSISTKGMQFSQQNLQDIAAYSTDVTYNMVTASGEGRLRLRLQGIFLGDQGGAHCFPGKVIITDPQNGYTISTCWNTVSEEVFESRGPNLIARVIFTSVDFPAKVLPNLAFSFNVFAVDDPKIEEFEINSDDNVTSVNFPKPYAANGHQKWLVWSEQNLTFPVLRFSTVQLAQFAFNGTTSCDNDRLTVSNAGKTYSFCGHVAPGALPRPIIGLSRIVVEMITDDRYEDVGFEAQVQMLAATPAESTLRYVTGSGVLLCSSECTWNFVGSDEEEYLIEMPAECQEAEFRTPGHEFQPLNCKTTQITLPAGSEIKTLKMTSDKPFTAIYSVREVPDQTTKPSLPTSTAKPSTQGVTSSSPPSLSTKQEMTSTGPPSLSTKQEMTSTGPPSHSTKQEMTSPMTRTPNTSRVMTSTTVGPSTTSTNSSGDGAPAPTTAPSRAGAIIGGCLTVVILALVAGFLVYFFWKRRSNGPSPMEEDLGYDNPATLEANRQHVLNDVTAFDNPLTQEATRNHVDSKTDLNMHEY